MVNAKERRIQKSRENNPLWPKNQNKRKSEEIKEEVPAKRVKARKSNDLEEKSYTGIAAKVGQNNIRPNFKLKAQAALHTQKMKKQRKLDRARKQQKIVKQEKAKNRRDNKPVRYTYLDLLLCILLCFLYIFFKLQSSLRITSRISFCYTIHNLDM